MIYDVFFFSFTQNEYSFHDLRKMNIRFPEPRSAEICRDSRLSNFFSTISRLCVTAKVDRTQKTRKKRGRNSDRDVPVSQLERVWDQKLQSDPSRLESAPGFRLEQKKRSRVGSELIFWQKLVGSELSLSSTMMIGTRTKPIKILSVWLQTEPK